MKIAVTGASGHVGANLCRMLLERGHTVRALIHNSNIGLETLDLEFLNGDVTSEADLRKLCNGIDVVFHLAAFISISKHDSRCAEINTLSCTRLLDAARDEGVRRIIHFSSIHAFSQHPLDKVLDESRELALSDDTSYNLSKALGHKIMIEGLSSGPEVVVLNPTAIIGPNDFRPSLLGNAVIRFYQGRNPGLVPGGYDWVDVRDVCEAAINAIDRGVPGECYLLGGSWQSLKTMADAVEELGGCRAPRLCLPMWIASVGAIFFNLQAKITGAIPLYTTMTLETLSNSHKNISKEKAARTLDYKPRPFEVTMADTIKWFKENSYI